MIDIHCHLLYGVDDGAKDIEESIAMLKEAKKQGIDQIILTPHYRHGMFPYDAKTIVANYKALYIEATQIGIKLHLGTEFHVNSKIIEYLNKKRCLPLGNSKYVLTEYGYESEYSYIYNMSRELLSNGYVPVIAHVERYACMQEDIDNAEELRELGALIQVNADAILGNDGRAAKKYCKEMLKAEYIDIVASDSHGIKNRANHMEKCYKYITKKFGEDYAELLMQHNPEKIVL